MATEWDTAVRVIEAARRVEEQSQQGALHFVRLPEDANIITFAIVTGSTYCGNVVVRDVSPGRNPLTRVTISEDAGYQPPPHGFLNKLLGKRPKYEAQPEKVAAAAERLRAALPPRG